MKKVVKLVKEVKKSVCCHSFGVNYTILKNCKQFN